MTERNATSADIRVDVHDPSSLTTYQRDQLRARTCAAGCGSRQLTHDGGYAYVRSGTEGARLGYAVRVCHNCLPLEGSS
ncbi:hypothetical protein [Streptomyces sp. NPDC057494]|uniref:hypothetical protein n=1 Tax=Streptomyces sp. NPDC057494 TaxID=3346148 RepID=UPI00369A0191